MDNFDFVGHLANTANAYDASVEVVDSFIRSYYREMHAVETKWFDRYNNMVEHERAFSEINAVFHKYWLAATRFTEYWQPSMGTPGDFEIADGQGLTTFQDMLGNFIVIARVNEKTSVYLLSVVGEELKIVNQFF